MSVLEAIKLRLESFRKHNTSSPRDEISPCDEIYSLDMEWLIVTLEKYCESVRAGIDREQKYREYRTDQDGSAVGACKEIMSWVQACEKKIIRS